MVDEVESKGGGKGARLLEAPCFDFNAIGISPRVFDAARVSGLHILQDMHMLQEVLVLLCGLHRTRRKVASDHGTFPP